jgi:RHS repeat-associated protein
MLLRRALGLGGRRSLADLTTAVTDGSGNLVVKENFGAAGARRGDNWTGKPTTAELTTIDGLTHRGFTFQERLDNLNLTNFNGRIYGETGQFFSPDPNLGDPTNTQSYNRYSYVLNNPLSRTDPTGFFSLGDLLNPFSDKNPLNPFGHTGRMIALAPFDPHIGNQLLRENPWLQTVGEIAACYWGGPWGCAAADAYVTRLNGGTWWQTAEAGFFSYASYGMTPDNVESGESWLVNDLEYGLVRGGLVGVEGGNFLKAFGFAAAGAVLNSYYTSYVGHEPGWEGGQSYPTPKVPCEHSLSNCYNFTSEGYIPEEDWDKNTIGLNRELQGKPLSDCFVQSGACSRFLNRVSGVQAVSQFHDT